MPKTYAVVPLHARRERGRDEQIRVDYSGELTLSRSRAVRLGFLTLGAVCVVFAIIGVILPGWPTTVWLIVATYCFSRSSPRFYNAILNHRIFGPLIRDYRSGLGIPRRAKILAIGMIVVFAGSSALFLIRPHGVRLLVASLGMIGVAYLARLPTRAAAEVR
jgi:uncharacterized membrane protein YbaN (DUF454 family)